MKLKFYMKSGNVISTSFVKDYHIKYEANKITYIKVVWYDFVRHITHNHIHFETIDFSQIECVSVCRF